MRLAESVQRGGLRALAHAYGSDLMDDHASIGDAVGMCGILQPGRNENTSSRLHDLAIGFLHVLRHLEFVVTPLPVKAEYRDSPLIDGCWIDLAIAILVGDHLAAAGESDIRAVLLLALALQGDPVTFNLVAEIVVISHAGHAAPATEFGVIAAQKIILAVKLPPRQVHVHSA